MSPEIIHWLLEGDVSIQYQVYRDLLSENRPDLQQRIASDGWGARLLALRNPDGHWGRGFYQPKWTSTHYSLLELLHLCISPDVPAIRSSIAIVLDKHKSTDGGINPHRSIGSSDVCINGMALSYATYFGAREDKLHSVVDFILSQKMSDGGFNCQSNFKGARHSSLHTTLSIAEGIAAYARHGYTYRLAELLEAEKTSREFILMHRLYLSDRTGLVIRPEFLKPVYPPRWHYDILRALDYFRETGTPYEERLQPALDVLVKKRGKDGRWLLPAAYPGAVHFEMEKAGQASRWNTLRALRVLNHFKLA